MLARAVLGVAQQNAPLGVVGAPQAEEVGLVVVVHVTTLLIERHTNVIRGNDAIAKLQDLRSG